MDKFKVSIERNGKTYTATATVSGGFGCAGFR